MQFTDVVYASHKEVFSPPKAEPEADANAAQAYPEGHPEHDMAKALSSMRKGDKIEIKGPFGSFKYQPGRYKAIGELLNIPTGATNRLHPKHWRGNILSVELGLLLCWGLKAVCASTGLLAGGMGVTPMINLSHVILKNPNDKVKVGLTSFATVQMMQTWMCSQKNLVSSAHLPAV